MFFSRCYRPPHLRGYHASKSSGDLLGVGTGPRNVNGHAYQLPQVIVSHLIYNDDLDGRFGRIHSPERFNGGHTTTIVHVVAERPYEGVHPLDVVEAVRHLVGVGQAAIDPEEMGEGLGRRDVLEAVGGGGGLEEVGVRGRGCLGAEAEREGELEVVGLLRLLRPALAAVAARWAVRFAPFVPAVLAAGEGGDGGRPLHLVAADAAPAGMSLQPRHPVRHGELGTVPLRRPRLVERGRPAVVVGRGRGRVVRRAAVVADAGGRGCGEEAVRRRPSPRCWPRRPLGGVPHRLPAAQPPARGARASGGGGRGARRHQNRIKSIDLARARSRGVC